jgi:putative nucleotidyltransferase with HDIG domain
VREMAHQVGVVSAERIAQELRQLLVHPRRARGLTLLFDVGLVHAVLPELAPMKGLPQGPPSAPTGDLWDHVLRVMDLLGPEPSFPLAMGALLHDVGKPRTVGWANDRFTFYHHEHVGARMADDIALRLKLSNEERERIVWLVEKHQYLCEAKQMRTSKLKRILGHEDIRDLLALHRADALAWGRGTEQVEYCEFLLHTWSPEDLNPAPLISGHDIMREFRIEPGRLVGELSDAVREAQLEGLIKTQEEALKLVERLLKERQEKQEPPAPDVSTP